MCLLVCLFINLTKAGQVLFNLRDQSNLSEKEAFDLRMSRS